MIAIRALVRHEVLADVRRGWRRRSGFSLVELVIASAVVGILATIAMPTVHRKIQRSNLAGAAEEISHFLAKARLEATRLGTPVVVEPDYATRILVAFGDKDDDLVLDTAEIRLFDLAMHHPESRSPVYLMGPDGREGNAADPAQSVDGLTPARSLRVAVFEPDGSIRHPGAFRVADGQRPLANVLEVRIAPRATARIRINEYIHDGRDGAGFYPSGDGEWRW
jgi:prepilin-type N-terminal cleavage/methylation domain-containing protein